MPKLVSILMLLWVASATCLSVGCASFQDSMEMALTRSVRTLAKDVAKEYQLQVPTPADGNGLLYTIGASAGGMLGVMADRRWLHPTGGKKPTKRVV